MEFKDILEDLSELWIYNQFKQIAKVGFHEFLVHFCSHLVIKTWYPLKIWSIQYFDIIFLALHHFFLLLEILQAIYKHCSQFK